MPPKKQTKKNKLIRSKNKIVFIVTAFKVNLIILAVVLVSYLMLGLICDPSFFQRDLKSKLAWGAGTSSTVSLQITGSPPLAIIDIPIMDLGGGFTLTWSYILSCMSWIVVFLLGLLILLASVLLLEYLLAKQRRFWIDEDNLKKRGLIS
jgi:hypothetical protein